MADRAVVVGAGSFGTAVAVLLARGGARTALLARTATQANLLRTERENTAYLPGVALPPDLRVGSLEGEPLARADYVFLAVPSRGLDAVIDWLPGAGLAPRAAVVSLAKGLVPPAGSAPTALLIAPLGPDRGAGVGRPAPPPGVGNEGAGRGAAAA